MNTLRDILLKVKLDDYDVKMQEISEKSLENFVLKMEKKDSDDDSYNFMVGITLDDDNVLNFETAFFESEIGVQVVSKTSL